MSRVAVVSLFLGVAVASSSSNLPQMRMTAEEVRTRASQPSGNQVGSSKLVGVQTTVLQGDPSKEGFYTILLYVPAHTSIPAHSHRDIHAIAQYRRRSEQRPVFWKVKRPH